MFEQEGRVKPLLYTIRVLLTGIHLMRTGSIEANLGRLNDVFDLPYVPDLIQRKREGAEHATLPDADVAFFRAEYERLQGVLEDAHNASNLPDAPTSYAALHDLLVRLRLEGIER